MVRWSDVVRDCFSAGIPRRSLRVARLVGTALNLINQGDALFGAGHVSYVKLLLTFAVPYCVATYGAVSYRASLEGSATAPQSSATSSPNNSGHTEQTERKHAEGASKGHET